MTQSEGVIHQAIVEKAHRVNSSGLNPGTYVTALSITSKPILACHYTMAEMGGAEIRLATFGMKELSDAAPTLDDPLVAARLIAATLRLPYSHCRRRMFKPAAERIHPTSSRTMDRPLA